MRNRRTPALLFLSSRETFNRIFLTREKSTSSDALDISYLSANFQLNSNPPDPVKVQELTEHKNATTRTVLHQYPYLMRYTFSGELAYTVRKHSPSDIIKKGGFKSSSELWYSNVSPAHPDFGRNSGSICFSFLPEVTGLFLHRIAKNITPYVIAVPLHGEYLLPGSEWREVISPGAFPLPKEWVARPVLKVCDRKMTLGSPMGFFAKNSTSISPKHLSAFKKFLECDEFELPELIDQGEDYPLLPIIKDSEWTKELQEKIKKYYQSINYAEKSAEKKESHSFSK